MLAPEPAVAQDAGPAVLVVVDGSASMARSAPDDSTLIAATRAAVDSLLARLPDDARVGVRAFGHRIGSAGDLRAQGCVDTELLAPAGSADDDVRAAVDGLRPAGWTALGAALTGAQDDLADLDHATVVVISDGEDNCLTPDPCTAAAALSEAVPDVVVDTIGLRLDGDRAARQLRCVAAATSGTFDTARDRESLDEAVRRAADRAAARHRNPTDGPTNPAAPTDAGTALPTRGDPRPVEGTRQPRDAPVVVAGRDHLQHVDGPAVLHYRLGGLGPGDHVDLQVDRMPSDPGDGGDQVAFWADVVDADGNWVAALSPGMPGQDVGARSSTTDLALGTAPAPYLLRVEVAAVGDRDLAAQDLDIRFRAVAGDGDGDGDHAVGPTPDPGTAGGLVTTGEDERGPVLLVVAAVGLLVLVALGILAARLVRSPWRRRAPA